MPASSPGCAGYSYMYSINVALVADNKIGRYHMYARSGDTQTMQIQTVIVILFGILHIV